MVDVVTPDKRRRMMAGIKGKNTKPELIVRKELFRRGFRYKLHDKQLPGRPDLVFPKYKSVIFVNGCFWHKHECKLFKWPDSNREFWKKKITENSKRDQRNRDSLSSEGWGVRTIWECALKGKKSNDIEREIDDLSQWLVNGSLQGN